MPIVAAFKTAGNLKTLTRALFALTALIFVSGGNPAQADERGWVLTQRSTKFGDAYIYISPSGLKMVSPKLGATVVTCAPGWSVAMYNDKTRQFYSTTFQKWTSDLNEKMAKRGESLAEKPWVRGGVGGVSGLKATQYSIQNASISARAGGKRSTVSAADCWVADEIQVPHQVSEMISKAYGLPNTRSFPLRISMVENGAPSVVLDTYYSKSCNIPSSWYSVPAGYGRASSEAEVMMDDDTKQMFKDMLNDAPGVTGSPQAQAPQQQQVQQQYVPSQYPQASPTAASSSSGSSQQQQQSGGFGISAGGTAQNPTVNLPGGYSLDREKLQRIKEALMKNGK